MPRIEDILCKHLETHLEFVAAVCTKVVEDLPTSTPQEQLAEVMRRSRGSINPADAMTAILAARD